MAWNKSTEKYVPDEVVDSWQEYVEGNFYASEIVSYLLNNWFGIDDKTTFLYDIASEYDVDLPEKID